MRIVFILLLLTAVPAPAQDRDFLDAFERAQKERPATILPDARIAPATEPGRPLIISGRVMNADRSKVIAGAIVFAWQTDRNGLYDVRGSAPHSWRLRGWARTDSKGRFTFRTIRPGSYPDSNNPQHVHFAVETSPRDRYFTEELQFADDPLVTQLRGQGRAVPDAREVSRTREADSVELVLTVNETRRLR